LYRLFSGSLQPIAVYCSFWARLGVPARRARRRGVDLPVAGLNPVQAVDTILMAAHCSRRIIGFEGRPHNVIHMFATYIMRKKWSSSKASSDLIRPMCKRTFELCEKIDFEN
jgi:hypothetical protein